jgi:hypothetical protein
MTDETLTEVTINGGIPGYGPDEHASAGDRTWKRRPGEAVEEFKTRVRSGVPADAKALVWGGLPE